MTPEAEDARCPTCGSKNPARAWVRVKQGYIVKFYFTDDEVGKWEDIATPNYAHYRCFDPFHSPEAVREGEDAEIVATLRRQADLWDEVADDRDLSAGDRLDAVENARELRSTADAVRLRDSELARLREALERIAKASYTGSSPLTWEQLRSIARAALPTEGGGHYALRHIIDPAQEAPR